MKQPIEQPINSGEAVKGVVRKREECACLMKNLGRLMRLIELNKIEGNCSLVMFIEVVICRCLQLFQCLFK